MRVLLLSAYAARSHVHWQQSLETMLGHWHWHILTLPPRYFSWRVRGNALYWSMMERAALEEPYDLLVATSMVDLATLRGLVPSLTHVPTVLYFHENQFAYPQYAQQHNLLETQVTSIYSALAADRLVFNSHYNRDTFMEGCAALLRRMPDRVPPAVVPVLQGKAIVIPVPITQAELAEVAPWWPGAVRQNVGKPLRLLWVGRFEHDKGAEGLLHILHGLEKSGLDYELAMTGQQFRQVPPVFDEIQSRYGHRLVQFGYIESIARYRALLRAADVVLSTALHEFQGLAVMEAVAHQCLPVVPDRLAYREIYPVECRYESHADDPDREADSAVALIRGLAERLQQAEVPRMDISAYYTVRMAPLYERAFGEVIADWHSH
jgi:glycosyltransferase involved in cell wall biosynthesis